MSHMLQGLFPFSVSFEASSCLTQRKVLSTQHQRFPLPLQEHQEGVGPGWSLPEAERRGGLAQLQGRVSDHGSGGETQPGSRKPRPEGTNQQGELRGAANTAPPMALCQGWDTCSFHAKAGYLFSMCHLAMNSFGPAASLTSHAASCSRFIAGDQSGRRQEAASG